MSLANIQGKLTRSEMKNIMAGSGTGAHGGQCYLMVGTWVGGCTAADIKKYCRYGGYCY